MLTAASTAQDMELMYPDGMWLFGKHTYGQYLHILRRTGSSNRPLPWEGITGRVKQESSKLIKELRLTAARTDVKVSEVEAKVGGVEAKVAEMQTTLDDIKQMLSTLANLERTN